MIIKTKQSRTAVHWSARTEIPGVEAHVSFTHPVEEAAAKAYFTPRLRGLGDVITVWPSHEAAP